MARVPRMRLTPMQRDILWLFRESGSESVATVANTLQSSATLSDGIDNAIELAAAIDGLRSLGLIEFCFHDPASGAGWTQEHDCAALTALSFLDLLTRSPDGSWTSLLPGGIGRWIELCITDTGYEALTT